MSRYRRVYPGMWRTPAFVGLSANAQRVALYVLSGPQSTPTGLGYLSIGEMAEDLGVDPGEARTALGDACEALGWHYDPIARVLWNPGHWLDNQPTNANVLKSLLRTVVEVPSCALVERFWANRSALPAYCLDVFGEMAGDVPANVRPKVTVNASANVPANSPANTPANAPANHRRSQESGSREQGAESRPAARSLVRPAWLRTVRGTHTLSAADVAAFEDHVDAHVARHGYAPDPAAHPFRWLDQRLAEFLQQRRERAAGDASARATEAFIRHHEAIAASIPKRTREEVAELMGRPPGRGTEEAQA